MRLNLGRRLGVVVAAALLLAPSQRIAAADSLFGAIRRDDGPAVEALLAAGADPRAADETGTTPLMYAAIYASPACMQVLLDKGAEINAANKFGATALMWSATRTPNLQLLLKKGVEVNARASDGSTALAAAARANNADAMKLLLAAGADITSPAARTVLLTAAYQLHDPQARRVLTDAGVVPTSKDDFKGPIVGRHLMNELEPDLSVRLLNAGVNPHEQLPLTTYSLPTYFIAARAGRLDVMKAFVEKGVDPLMPGPRGWSGLMLIAGGETPSIAAMQYLLDKGADVNAVDEDGRTALDWALTRGETEISTFLRRAGAKTAAIPTPAPAPVAAPRSTREAIERAIAKLQPAGPKFSDRTKCNSCHNQNIPGIAVALAQRKGLAVDEELAPHSLVVTDRAWQMTRRETALLSDTNIGGFQSNTSYGLLEMAEVHAPATPASDAMVIGLSFRQRNDGSWPEGVDTRPPLTPSAITATALAVRALHEYAPPGRKAEMHARVLRARDYLMRAPAADPQDAAFKLLGLVWSGAQAADIARAKAQVLDLQHPDGGWAQLPSMDSDAYATGLTLYALHAAGMSAKASAYRNGTNYLLKTQLEDGTWFVRTRAFGFQIYFETGFPHGKSQFISTTATAWAAAALSYAVEP